MKQVRSFIIGTAILTVATGAVLSSPLATFAQNDRQAKAVLRSARECTVCLAPALR